MMIERNVFRIRFGRMKEAKAIWLEIIRTINVDTQDRKDKEVKVRMLTDITGPSYILVIESELRDFIHIGFQKYQWLTNNRVSKLYQQFTEICESSERTLYHIDYVKN
ncbi:MAG TPA: hypothetical protein PKC30_01820 [Saprospiraceae bacterium]|nr:hypothetical protein [Saprospiraceae bacterium]